MACRDDTEEWVCHPVLILSEAYCSSILKVFVSSVQCFLTAGSCQDNAKLVLRKHFMFLSSFLVSTIFLQCGEKGAFGRKKCIHSENFAYSPQTSKNAHTRTSSLECPLKQNVPLRIRNGFFPHTLCSCTVRGEMVGFRSFC